MKQYVTCIVYNESRTQTVLIIKNGKLKFLEGKLMPPGGSVEDGESYQDAASREFLEECGVATSPENWRKVGKLILNDEGFDFAECHYMTITIPDDLLITARTMETEMVIITNINALTFDKVDADVLSMMVVAYSHGGNVGDATVTRFL